MYKLAAVVEGNLKAPFSIATTERSRGRCYSIPWIAPFTLDLYLIMLSVKQGGHHHHHHVVPLARISLIHSRHFSLSFIASGRSSGLHPVSSYSCCMYVRAGRPAFARPYVGVHMSTSLMSSSLLLQQCPACLVRLTWIVFVMGGRWPYFGVFGMTRPRTEPRSPWPLTNPLPIWPVYIDISG